MLRKTKRSIDNWPYKAGRCARENFCGRILLSSSEKWLFCIHSMFSRSTSVGAKMKAASEDFVSRGKCMCDAGAS